MRGWAWLGFLVGAGCAAPAGPERAAVRHEELVEGAKVAIRFAADWSVTVEGDLRAGERVHIDYDPDRLPGCRGTKYGHPAWTITGWARVNGGEAFHFLVAPDPPGPAMDPQPWVDLPAAGELELWFHNTSAWGCSEWDSNFGHDFRFTVEPPPGAPDWMGGEVSAISRWTCDGGEACAGSLRPLAEGFLFDTAARQRATVASLYFRVWEPEVTDWDNPDLWRELDVRLHRRFHPDAPFEWRWVRFERRVGNDARYAVDLRREMDPLGGGTRTTTEECPDVPLRRTADGHYVETDVEYFFSVNGVELRPAPGDVYRGRFQDYEGLYAPCPVD